MRAGISLAVILFCAPAWCAEQGPAFSAAQAARGHEAYTLRCTMCHGENLDDGDFGGVYTRSSHSGLIPAACITCRMISKSDLITWENSSALLPVTSKPRFSRR